MRGLAVPDLEQSTAEQVLAHMVEHHHPRLALACSFQKEETVLIDMLLRSLPDARVFMIDTGVLFPETLQTWREFEERFGVKIEVQDASSGGEPWSGPEHCCSVAKVAALEDSLAGAEGWITGLRREQGPTRAQTELIERDACGIAWHDCTPRPAIDLDSFGERSFTRAREAFAARGRELHVLDLRGRRFLGLRVDLPLCFTANQEQPCAGTQGCFSDETISHWITSRPTARFN